MTDEECESRGGVKQMWTKVGNKWKRVLDEEYFDVSGWHYKEL